MAALSYPIIPYNQYANAYPQIHYNQPPSAANGYGWHGNGYGWQLDPKSWYTPPLYPTLDKPVVAVEEPMIQVEKVSKQNAWVSLGVHQKVFWAFCMNFMILTKQQTVAKFLYIFFL